MNSCAPMGGTTCRKSKGRVINSFVSMFWKIASLPLTFTRGCLKVVLMLKPAATSVKVQEYLGTPNMTALDLQNSTCTGKFCLRHLSVHRQRIFWGAPAHLIGMGGSVKIALPDLMASPSLAVFSAKSSWQIEPTFEFGSLSASFKPSTFSYCSRNPVPTISSSYVNSSPLQQTTVFCSGRISLTRSTVRWTSLGRTSFMGTEVEWICQSPAPTMVQPGWQQ